MDLSSYVKRAADGSVDQDSTVAQFKSDLATFVTESAEEQSNIASAVNAVFDKNLGQRITMPALCAAAAAELNAQPQNWQSITEKVAAYVRSNTQDFSIAKGKGGGTARVRDLPVKSA